MQAKRVYLGMAKRVDANQADIVATFKAAGATVQHLHMVGKGCPDLLVGYRGVNYVVEVKDGRNKPSRQRLTDDEDAWHAAWRGQVCIVRSVDEAVALLNWP